MIFLTILSIIGLIAICWVCAKYNKNDNLFWILLISLFAGMAGGAIFDRINKESVKGINTNFEQVNNPTQVTQAPSIGFCTEPGTLVFTTNPVSKVPETPAVGIKISALSKVYGEIRGQPTKFNPFHLGNPGMPFDTS